MSRRMGFDFGLEKADLCFKRKFRWLLKIPAVCSDRGVNSLPPSKAARPGIEFKSTPIQHLNETIYRPTKPEWKPIQLVLFDLKKNEHPIFKWIRKQYDPKDGTWQKPGEFILDGVTLELYNGCGDVLEKWDFENVWMESAQFGDLDMSDSEVVTVDVTLRYDRANLDE